MGSPHIDKNSPQPDSPQEAPPPYALTYLLGPPMRGVDAIAFAEVAAERGLTREQFWLQVVLRNVEKLLESDAEGRSILDDMVSDAIGQLVTLWEVEGTVEVHLDRRVPGLVINSHKVLDALGRPVARQLADRATLSRIARALMAFNRADWATCSISDGKTEFVFPILPEGAEKEARDA